jgi:hypothetical protein
MHPAPSGLSPNTEWEFSLPGLICLDIRSVRGINENEAIKSREIKEINRP